MTRSSRLACIESLEHRTMLSKPAPWIKFSVPGFYFYDIAPGFTGGSGGSDLQYLVVRNGGDMPLTLKSNSISFSGPHASEFKWSGKTLPATIAPGGTRTYTLQFTAGGVGVREAVININSNDPKRRTVSLPVRGLGAKGAGGDLEPSLQQVVDLYDIPIDVGDDNPGTTKYPVPNTNPADEVDMQALVKAGSGPVSIELLGLFVNERGPATAMGYYHLGQTEIGKRQLFTIPDSDDSQSVTPVISGKTKFDLGAGPFGIYTTYPNFSRAEGSREAYSEDAMNQWESTSSKRRKIRFFTLKDSAGNVVPNAYVFAAEDWNVDYDFQDVVGIIRNVKRFDPTPQVSVYNVNNWPSNTRMVFNSIANLDVVRPNVLRDTSTFKIINTGDANLLISDIATSNGSQFSIISGDGSNITLTPGQSRDVTVKFVGTGSGNNALITGAITIASNDPTDPIRTVDLAGFWQKYSEKTPGGTSVEPTLAQITQMFGYTTTIVGAGQKMNTGGKPTAVGDEVLSAYWQAADPTGSVRVKMIAAYHRTYNSDPITGEILTAASSVRWYAKGKSATTTRVFVHNIDENQIVLPHLSDSTTKWAEGSFKPSGVFGWKVDSLYSDDTLNPLNYDSNGVDIPGTGHAFRFYPLKDAKGNLVPNTYIMAHDYTNSIYVNFDYQDNIYIVTNIKPASTNSVSSVGATAPTIFSDQALVKDESGEDLVLV